MAGLKQSTNEVIRYYMYNSYETTENVVNIRERKVPKGKAQPIEYLVVNIGGPFERIGGNNEAIGGDVTKMG